MITSPWLALVKNTSLHQGFDQAPQGFLLTNQCSGTFLVSLVGTGQVNAVSRLFVITMGFNEDVVGTSKTIMFTSLIIVRLNWPIMHHNSGQFSAANLPRFRMGITPNSKALHLG